MLCLWGNVGVLIALLTYAGEDEVRCPRVTVMAESGSFGMIHAGWLPAGRTALCQLKGNESGCSHGAPFLAPP